MNLPKKFSIYQHVDGDLFKVQEIAYRLGAPGSVVIIYTQVNEDGTYKSMRLIGDNIIGQPFFSPLHEFDREFKTYNLEEVDEEKLKLTKVIDMCLAAYPSNNKLTSSEYRNAIEAVLETRVPNDPISNMMQLAGLILKHLMREVK